MWSARNWPDAVTCPTCDRRFSPQGIERHVCHGVPATRTPWRTCKHCGGRFTSKGLSRHETACAVPKATHGCDQCKKTYATQRLLTLHRNKAHPADAVTDPRIDRLRAVAVGSGWTVVSDEPDCVLAIRITDPVTVVHAVARSGDIVGRVVSRAHGPRHVGGCDNDAPVPLTLDVNGYDDIRAVLERMQ